jgi:AraC family transcriptional regulator
MPGSPIVVLAEKELHPFYEAVISGVEQASFYSCDQAFTLLTQYKAEIGIIDCGFRVEVGVKLLKEIKKASPGTIIIFITEFSSEETAIQAFTAGARAYLRKPINLFETQNLLKNFLALKRGSKEQRVPPAEDDHLFRETIAQATSDKPSNLIHVLRFMQENLSKPLDLDACAKEAGLSKYHFCRVFNRYFGITPMRFLNLLRVNRAKDLLLREDLNIGEVASRVGFNDQGRFVKAFRKFTGFGPGAYRTSARRYP